MLNQLFQRNKNTQALPAMQFDATLTSEDISLSSGARAKMQELISAADEDFAGIRLFVMGGGCGGMAYSMTYADTVGPLDAVLDLDGVRLVVDAVALNYLRGCEIDYVKQGLNESFVFRNVFQSIGGSGVCAGCGAAGGNAY